MIGTSVTFMDQIGRGGMLVIVGGGPIGLEMAVLAVKEGMEVTLVERGPSTSHNVLSWGHVELFSPYSLNMSEAGKSVLQEAGKALPDMDSFPTGAEYVRDYLDVLSSWLSSRCTIMCNSEVTAMARGALLRHELGAVRRSKVAFRIMIRTADGNEQILEAARVVDASGTYNQPASMGMGGMPALGESQMASRNDEALIRQIPDVKARREEFIGKKTVVVGAGASAITVINGLKKLSSGGGEDTGIVDVTWVVRGGVEPYRRVDNDPLPQRDALYSLGNKLSMGDKCGGDRFRVRFIPNSGVLSMEKTQDGKVNVKVLKRREGEYEGGEEECIAADRVISCCGFKPDDGLWSQLQVHQCYASSAPMKLAGALLAASGGGGGDCLNQASHGPETLLSPEPDFYVIGMKSYGTGSAFLLKVGHQQVLDVMSLIKANLSK